MITRTTEAPPLGHINLQGGWPTPRLHPAAALGAAASGVFGRQDVHEDLKYGPELGDRETRDLIAKWLAESYQQGPVVTGDRIIITNGASNGLATLLQKLADPASTATIWMVEPTYFLACPIFRDAGFSGRIRGVPEAEDGIDLDFLARALEEADASRLSSDGLPPGGRKDVKKGYPKTYRHVIYLIPTFSNPSGKTMQLRSRERLVRLARKHDALVVSDDVYDVLMWPAEESDGRTDIGPCPPRLVDIDRRLEGASIFGNCVSNGSFSKIVAPGVRVGWIEGNEKLIQALGTVGATVSGGCQGHMSSLIIGQMLAAGSLQSHISDVLIKTYRQRYYSMMHAIRQYLEPRGARVAAQGDYEGRGIAGGYFVFVRLPQYASARDAARVALEDYDLRVAPGIIFSVPDDPSSQERAKNTYGPSVRLCWAWNEESALVEGIRRLACALDSQKSLREGKD